MPLTLLHRNLVTFGSPHQGVFGIPECEAEVHICFLIFAQEYSRTQGGKCPFVWVGAPTDIAWGVRALDPGLRFRNSFHDSLGPSHKKFPQPWTGPCGPGSVLAWPLQPDSLPGRQMMYFVYFKKFRQLMIFCFKEKQFQSGSHYLADLNNERESKNETYKEVLASRLPCFVFYILYLSKWK